jgi:hypothetical protein
LGNLTITQKFFGGGIFVDEANIILVGNGVSLHWKDPDQLEWIEGEEKVFPFLNLLFNIKIVLK